MWIKFIYLEMIKIIVNIGNEIKRVIKLYLIIIFLFLFILIKLFVLFCIIIICIIM